MGDAEIARSLESTLALFAVVAVVALSVIRWRLSRFHPEEWRALAEPGERGTVPLAGWWRLVRFAVSLRHLRLDDLTLSLACVAFGLGVLAVASGAVGWLLLKAGGG